jgi:hypothetical protein
MLVRSVEHGGKKKTKKRNEANMEIKKKRSISIYKLHSSFCGTINGSEGSRYSKVQRYLGETDNISAG